MSQGVPKPPLIPGSMNLADEYVTRLKVGQLVADDIEVLGNETVDGNLTVIGTITGGTLTDGTFSTTGGVVTGATIIAASDNVAANSLKTTGAVVNVAAAAPPSVGQSLTATSATTATWQTPVVTGPAAPVNSVQFNNAGVFGGNAGLTTNGTNLVAGTGLSATTGDIVAVTGDIVAQVGDIVATLGGITAETGLSIGNTANQSMGTATLVGGTVTVANTYVAAGDFIFLSVDSFAGAASVFSAPTASIVAATSFVINAETATATLDATNTSVVRYLIVRPV